MRGGVGGNARTATEGSGGVTLAFVVLVNLVVVFVVVLVSYAERRALASLAKRVWALEKNAMDDLIARNREKGGAA